MSPTVRSGKAKKCSGVDVEHSKDRASVPLNLQESAVSWYCRLADATDVLEQLRTKAVS